MAASLDRENFPLGEGENFSFVGTFGGVAPSFLLLVVLDGTKGSLTALAGCSSTGGGVGGGVADGKRLLRKFKDTSLLGSSDFWASPSSAVSRSGVGDLDLSPSVP